MTTRQRRTNVKEMNNWLRNWLKDRGHRERLPKENRKLYNGKLFH